MIVSSQQLNMVIAMVVLTLIAALAIGVVVRSKRRFAAGHTDLVLAWDAAAVELGLGWVVPKETVLADQRTPALQGTVDGRTLYVALRDDGVSEDLLPKWVVDVHVTCKGTPRADKAALKRLRRGRRASATLVGSEVRVQRAGLMSDKDEIVAYAREVLAVAAQLEASP